MRTSGAAPNHQTFLQVEFRELDNEARRMVLEKDGLQLKIDMTLSGVLALVSEGLDTLVENVSDTEMCLFCKQDGHDKKSDCDLVRILTEALAELTSK